MSNLKLRKLGKSKKLDRRRTLERQAHNRRLGVSYNALANNKEMIACSVLMTWYAIDLLVGWYLGEPRDFFGGSVAIVIPQNHLPWYVAVFTGYALLLWHVTLKDIKREPVSSFSDQVSKRRKKRNSSVLGYVVVPLVVITSFLSLLYLST